MTDKRLVMCSITGSSAHPGERSAPLLRAKLSLLNGNALETLEDFRRVRGQGAD